MKKIKKRSKVSLKWRLFAYFSIFTVILLAILWICQTLLLDTLYRQIKADSLNKCANEMAYAIKSEDYQDTLEELARGYDVSVKVVNTKLETVYEYAVSSTDFVTKMMPNEIYVLCDRARKNGGSYTKEFEQYIIDIRGEIKHHADRIQNMLPGWKDSSVPKEYESNKRPTERYSILKNLISTRGARMADGSGCYIIVDSVITPVNATVKTLAVLLMYISIFTVVFALVLAFLLARRISRPIIKMNRNANRLAKGDYDVTFDSRGYAEIEQLNDTMNYAAKELSKADELRRELIANVSHDLRTPLTMIIGYSEMMRDIPGENSPENVQAVIDEATRLSSLVTDLLDISRLQAGTAEVNKAVYNLTDSVHGIISRFDKLKDDCTISFEAQDDVYISADEKRISQVIYNLIINAINYSGDNKSVVVKQIVHNDVVRIEVTDNGDGIPKEDLPYIWDRYYRVDKTHKRAKMGTGLGLSIVKTVLESHEAVYGVDSTLGIGSTFWFELECESSDGSEEEE